MDEPEPGPNLIAAEQVVRRTVVAALLLGAALAFLLTGRSPGWQPFALVTVVSLISLLFIYFSGRGSDLMGFFALAILLLAMFWEPGRPWAALTGTVLVLLNAFSDGRNQQQNQAEQASTSQP